MKRRLQKNILSIGIILSLLASAFAACACSHHAAVETEAHTPSCHQTALENEQSKAAESGTENKQPSISEGCNCFVKNYQPSVIGKSENVKAQKVAAPAILPFDHEFRPANSRNESAKIHFEYHFYNSNYLRKLTPPRAPPFS